jgi:hypothetical protein
MAGLNLLPSLSAVSSLSMDGAYAVDVKQPPALPPGGASDVIVIPGGFRRGKAGVPVPVKVSSASGTSSMLAAVGDGIVNGQHIPFDGARTAITAMPEGTDFVFIPVRDGTETSATLEFVDDTGFAAATVSILSAANTNTFTMTAQNGTGPTFVTPVVTAGAGDNPGTIAEQVAALMNAMPPVAGPSPFLQKLIAADSGAIAVKALKSGTSGNSIKAFATTTGGTVSPSASTPLSGGSAPGILFSLVDNSVGTLGNGATGVATLTSGTLANSPVFQLDAAYPYNGQQTWRGIVGYAVAGGPYDAATFIANAVSAILGTLNAFTVGSSFFTPVAGQSTGHPLLNSTLTASGGTDGTSTLTPQDLIGTDGLTGRTGAHAVRGTAFRVITLAECFDPTIDVQLQALLDTTGGIGVTAFSSGPGSDTSNAQAAKTTYALSNKRIVRMMDWLSCPDSQINGQPAFFSPAGGAAGVIASLDPWESTANKPEGVAKGGVFGTERTISNTNAVDPQTEGSLRKQLGFNWFTTSQPREGGLLGLAHGKTSDGSNISDVMMFDYVCGRVLAILNRYTSKPMGPPPAAGAIDTDDTRRKVRNDLAALKTEFLNPNSPQLVDFDYQFVGTVNDVQNDRNPWAIQGETLSNIEFSIAEVAVGNNVVASASN